VRLWASFYPSPADPEDVLELVGLTDKADDRVKRLSGGPGFRSWWADDHAGSGG